jgi:hypothetical protein
LSAEARKRGRAPEQLALERLRERLLALRNAAPTAAYFAAIPLPDKAQADAYHLALAAWHGLDYLVSWNCTHIVSGRVRMIVEEVNAQFGIRTPIICTPEELMEVA